jgi:AcrR family transcriptional regulator
MPDAGKNSGDDTASAVPQKKKRLSPDERRQDFIQKAAELFADEGFGGGTRELARKLGVSQPLLYRYFPSKEDLIEAVYRSVFLDRWNPEWDALLADRSTPIRKRLEMFYASYTDAIFDRQWIRIFFFAGLKGLDINKRYLIDIVQNRILKRIIEEYRHEAGLPPQKKPATTEMELALFLHGGIFYYGVRKHVYDLAVPEDKHTAIVNALDIFLEGVSALYATPVKVPASHGRRKQAAD